MIKMVMVLPNDGCTSKIEQIRVIFINKNLQLFWVIADLCVSNQFVTKNVAHFSQVISCHEKSISSNPFSDKKVKGSNFLKICWPATKNILIRKKPWPNSHSMVNEQFFN